MAIDGWKYFKRKIWKVLLQWTPSHGRAKAGRRARTNSNNYVPIQDVALKTYRERWTIEKGGGRGSGRSVLVAWQDDDDETFIVLGEEKKSGQTNE